MLTRFAPSPTGYLHLGHALAAKQAFGLANQNDGHCLLRIEDIDHTRCRPEYTSAIYEDLDWLGFDWRDPVRVQSGHIQAYGDVIIDLMKRGLAYPCALTRSEITSGARTDIKTANTGMIDRYSQAIKKNESSDFAIRLNLQSSLKKVSDYSLTYDEKNHKHDKSLGQKGKFDAKSILSDWSRSDRPDPIIARKDIGTSYHIAVTHDDALQNITHIVRGVDLFDETPIHVLLQRLMGWPTPTYHHHALLRRDDGVKLSKRNQDTTIRSLREKGLTAQQVLDMAVL